MYNPAKTLFIMEQFEIVLFGEFIKLIPWILFKKVHFEIFVSEVDINWMPISEFVIFKSFNVKFEQL